MSDLDTEFRDLRRVLHTTIDQPDLVDIAVLARARTTRRRTQWSAVAAVLVVAATDGGRSWEAHPLPPTADGKIYARLQAWSAIGEDDVVVDRTTLDDRHERILSVDGGQTWSVVEEPIEAAPSPEISTAGGLVGGCPPLGPTEVRCPTVATVLPDGRTSPLVGQPPLTYPVPGYYPTTEGTWWVHGQDPVTGELALAVSRDEGRTWTAGTLGLPVEDRWTGYVSVAEHDGTLRRGHRVRDHAGEHADRDVHEHRRRRDLDEDPYVRGGRAPAQRGRRPGGDPVR